MYICLSIYIYIYIYTYIYIYICRNNYLLMFYFEVVLVFLICPGRLLFPRKGCGHGAPLLRLYVYTCLIIVIRVSMLYVLASLYLFAGVTSKLWSSAPRRTRASPKAWLARGLITILLLYYYYY